MTIFPIASLSRILDFVHSLRSYKIGTKKISSALPKYGSGRFDLILNLSDITYFSKSSPAIHNFSIKCEKRYVELTRNAHYDDVHTCKSALTCHIEIVRHTKRGNINKTDFRESKKFLADTFGEFVISGPPPDSGDNLKDNRDR